MPIRTYRGLNVFNESYSLALQVSRRTKKYPGPEQYELARQLRRAARSIPVNIVEGWAKRASAAGFKGYLQVAIGSCEGCKLWLDMSRDEGFLTEAECSELQNKFNGVLLQSLWKWKQFPR